MIIFESVILVIAFSRNTKTPGPPLLFEVKDRAKYYATLKAGKENLKEYLLDDFLESLNFYLR